MVQELGDAACDAILAALQDAAADYGVGGDAGPALWVKATGAATPTADACEGMAWIRVASVLPSDGSGAPASTARWDTDAQAWAYVIEVGFLWCHQNITDDGGWIDPDTEAAYASRDALWRLVMLDALGYRWRPAVDGTPLGAAVLGQTLSPVTPVGPDGGYSGAVVQATVTATGLAIC